MGELTIQVESEELVSQVHHMFEFGIVRVVGVMHLEKFKGCLFKVQDKASS